MGGACNFILICHNKRFFCFRNHSDKRREIIQDLRLAPEWMAPICHELAW